MVPSTPLHYDKVPPLVAHHIKKENMTTTQTLTVSPDGYVRLSLEQLQAIPLNHLISGMDETGEAANCDASATEITGYTEWVSNGTPAITLGWDWHMQAQNQQTQLHRVSDPRSNIMLTDNISGMDLGQAKTTTLLQLHIDKTHSWQEAVLAYLNLHYA